MESFTVYLIRCVLVSGLLTSYYVLALRGRRMHAFNRFYLLSSVAVALVLPLVHIHWAPWTAGGRMEGPVLILRTAPVKSDGASWWWLLALGVSVLVSAVLLLVSLAKIRTLYTLKRVSRCTPLDGYELVETEAPGTPFSFFRNLFWRSGMDRDDEVNRKMLAHELAHIRGRHSWDVLGMRAVLCVFWMNPFFWYIQRELMMVLEFTADAASGVEGEPEVLARMLLQAYEGGLSPALSNGLFYSPIKRRLVMITKNHGGRRAWMRKALVVPVALGAVLFFACSKQETAKTPPLPPSASTLQADGIDARKLKLDSSLKIKLVGLRLKQPHFMFDNGAKLRLKLTMDSLSAIHVTGNTIGVKN